MAKKASMCKYKHDAFVGYDCRVRDRAGSRGLEVFAEMSAEDVATFFCAENMLYNKDKSSKKSWDGTRKKQNKPCLAYNDGGCSYRLCNFSHVCLVCEDQGHGRRDCPILKQRRISQK